MQVYVDRAGGRNSPWGNLRAESGLHSYIALILLYLQDPDTCSWGSTKAWQVSLQRWVCLHLTPYISLVLWTLLKFPAPLKKHGQNNWYPNFSHVQSPYQIPACVPLSPFPLNCYSRPCYSCSFPSTPFLKSHLALLAFQHCTLNLVSLKLVLFRSLYRTIRTSCNRRH